MSHRCVRAAAPIVCLIACLGLLTGFALAQNENETIGFQSNHIFESGQFGEDIDILNGGLNLTVPIGPRYQVNANLGYQLKLKYNSKVWDISLYGTMPTNRAQEVLPYNESTVGLGFSLHLGRIFVDSRWIEAWLPSGDGKTYSAGWIQTYKWVDQDGTQHEFYHEDFIDDPNPPPDGVDRTDRFHPIFNQRRTTDLSYVLISGPSSEYCTGTGATSCFRVETPDGLVYTLSKRMECADPDPTAPAPLGPDDAKDPLRHAMYQSYCGWYTTRIEDRSVNVAADPEVDPPVYPVFVSVNYSNTEGYKHTISSISDSTGRTTTLSHCQWQAEPSTPPTDPSGDDIRCAGPGVPYNIHAIALTAIEFPAFGNSPATGYTPAFTADKATFRFVYRFESIRRANRDFQGAELLTNDPVLKLVRVDYPAYLKHEGRPDESLDRYSMYFKYMDNEGTTGYDYGELTCRTLPLGRVINNQALIGNPCEDPDDSPGPTRFRYHYDYYVYAASYLSSGQAPKNANCALLQSREEYIPDGLVWAPPGTVCGGPISGGGAGMFTAIGFSRHLRKKSLLWAPGGPSPLIWDYDRGLTHLTNPIKVKVADPFGNDTVYWFHASASGGAGIALGEGAEDGYAPEWDDGTNYRIDYYEGNSTGGRLVRSELQEHDADKDFLSPMKRSKRNVRVKRMTTQYVDDGGRSRGVARENWDEFSGHWLTEIESGFEVPAPRVTRRLYGSDTPTTVYRTDRLRYEEVSDGSRVVSRTDNSFNSDGRLVQSIARAALPGAVGTVPDVTSQPGDVKTTFTYSTVSGNVLTKTMTTGLASDHGYAVRYSYAPAWLACSAAPDECGGYVATKEFLNPDTTTPAFLWYAIERSRDWNTGLVVSTKDPSGYEVNYEYDPLGRVTAVRPSGEDETKIDYLSLVETTVTQGDDSGPDFTFTRYRYDSLGRLAATQKRSSDSTKYACQKNTYDAANRVTFESEWKLLTVSGPPGNTCVPGQNEGEVGTTFDYRDPVSLKTDPFGRVRRVIPALSGSGQDDKSTSNEYFGNSMRVITKGLRGAAGSLFPSVSVFYRDAFNRLTVVDKNPGTVCSFSGKPCGTGPSGPACPTGEGACVAVDGGAGAIYTYDTADNLVQADLTDGPITKQTRRFAYDGLKRLKWAQNPENGTVVTSEYDALGNLLRLQDASGNQQSFVYDNAGRQTRHKLTPAGGTERTISVSTYDEERGTYAAGKLTTIASNDEGGTLQLTERRFYDAAARGRLSKTEHQFADWGTLFETTIYTFDTRGQLVEIDYPQENPSLHTPLKTTYTYSNGNVVTATELGNGTIPTAVLGSVTYNAAGAVATVTTPQGGLTTITFDDRNRPSEIKGGVLDAEGHRTYESGGYQYDGAGNIYQIGSNTYSYDAASRLIAATSVVPSATTSVEYVEQFTYDALGNMLQRNLTSNGIAESDMYTYPMSNNNRIANRTTTIGTTATGSVNFFHDTNGNLIEGGRRWYVDTSLLEDVEKYEYGALNRLLRLHKASSAAGTVVLSEIDKFAYDANGNRIWKQQSAQGSAVKTYFVRNTSGQVLTEFRGVAGSLVTPEWSKDTIYLGGRLLAMKENLRPGPPSGLKASQSQSGSWHVFLSWRNNTETDRSGYKIYRSQGSPSNFTLLGNSTQATFPDPTNYGSGTTVYYRVTCVDSAGFESLPSANIKIITGDVTAPTKPNVSATAGDRRVVLSWTTGTDVAGIAGYEITRRTDPNGASSPITSQLVTETSYIDLNLTNGTTYYYQVRGKDTSGNWGLYSCNLQNQPPDPPCVQKVTPKDLTPPAPPMGVKAGLDCGTPGSPEKIVISWDSNPATDGVNAYEVYRDLDSDFLDSNFTGLPPVAIRAANETSYEDTDVSTSTMYYYAVKAVDGSVPANKSEFSLTVSSRTRDHTVPIAVRLGTLTGDGSVIVKWRQPAGDTTTSYNLYRKLNVEAGCGSYVQVGSIGSFYANSHNGVFELKDGSVPNNQAYDYAVTAVPLGGVESSFSKPALAIPVARISNLYQCEGQAFDPSQCSSFVTATEVAWSSPVEARPYQPILASSAEHPTSYLKGYHLYHHRVCLQEPINHWYDDSPMTQIVINPNDPVDHYLVNDDVHTCPAYRVADARYWIAPSTPLSPPVPSTVASHTDPFMDCAGNHNNSNCLLPKAVYKVFAEGTWLTVESDWPDYWDGDAGAPGQRCDQPLLSSLPTCSAETHRPLPPTSVTSIQDGPGTVKVSWTQATQPAGVQIAGYYIYARQDAGTSKFDLMHPLPYQAVSAGGQEYRVTGLQGALGAGVHYRFGVAAYDLQGRVSTVKEASSGLTPSLSKKPQTKLVLWSINDGTHLNDKSRRGLKLEWALEAPASGYTRDGLRVYRSGSPSFESYCALLRAGANPSGIPACPNDRDGGVGDPYAYSDTLTLIDDGTYYWDRTVAQNHVYYYKVTEVLHNSTQVKETTLQEANTVSGKELPFDSDVLPPPTGLRAWSPWTGSEKSGVYLKWCPYRQPNDPPIDLPSVTAYKIYRATSDGGPYDFLATVAPGCLDEGQRCSITTVGSATTWLPVSCTETMGTCEVTDQTFAMGCNTTSGCGGDYPCKENPEAGRYYYVVTAVTAAGAESMFSNGNGAWLNYPYACVPNWKSHRDPDGTGETLVCGQENAQLLLDDGAPEAAISQDLARAEELPATQGIMAPHRTIGQIPNPYNPPAQFVFYHLDHLGSPRVVLDRSAPVAAVLNRFHYLPFGEERPVEAPNTMNARAFTGHERDRESDLDYMIARYYSSSLGRFMAVDPGDDSALDDPQSWNKYAYVRNNPINATDPSGEFADYLIDIPMAAISVYQAVQDPSVGNIVGAVLDVVAAATPFVPAVAGRLVDAGQTANKLVDAGQATNKATDAARAVPNPHGRVGGPAHQGKVQEVAAGVEGRGLEASRELKVSTPGGEKGTRYVDVAGKNPQTGEVVEMHQVGRQTGSGQPVARERRAMDDIENATGKRPEFHPYNEQK